MKEPGRILACNIAKWYSAIKVFPGCFQLNKKQALYFSQEVSLFHCKINYYTRIKTSETSCFCNAAQDT